MIAVIWRLLVALVVLVAIVVLTVRFLRWDILFFWGDKRIYSGNSLDWFDLAVLFFRFGLGAASSGVVVALLCAACRWYLWNCKSEFCAFVYDRLTSVLAWLWSCWYRKLHSFIWAGIYFVVLLMWLEPSRATSTSSSTAPIFQAGIAFAGAMLTDILTRRITSAQLTPTLLARFNSEEFYQIRRYVWREAFLWMAGDRYVLSSHHCASRYSIALGARVASKDRAKSVAQLLGFIAELQSYHSQGLVSASQLRQLFEDRMVWFLPFLVDFNKSIGKSQSILAAAGRFPYSFVSRPFRLFRGWDDRWKWTVWFDVNCLDWLIATLWLRPYVAVAERPKGWGAREKANGFENDPFQYSGLQSAEDVKENVPAAEDVKENVPFYITLFSIETKETSAHMRLRRMKGKAESPNTNTAKYLLEYAAAIPNQGVHVCVDHICEPRETSEGKEVGLVKGYSEQFQTDWNAVRYWFARLLQNENCRTSLKPSDPIWNDVAEEVGIPKEQLMVIGCISKLKDMVDNLDEETSRLAERTKLLRTFLTKLGDATPGKAKKMCGEFMGRLEPRQNVLISQDMNLFLEWLGDGGAT